MDSDINKVKKNAICTGVNTKESLITNYFKIPLTNLRAGDKAISVSGARIWNNIPNSVKQAQSLDVFKRELKEYLIKSQQALIQ